MIVRLLIPRKRSFTPAPWSLSLVAHGGLLAWLALWPEGAATKNPSEYDQFFKQHESKIVFYKFKDKLPDVKPVEHADNKPPRAEFKIPKQFIVSNPKNAPKGQQMIWEPAPEIVHKETPLPNILALQMAGPERRKFALQTPAAQQKTLPAPKIVETPQALAHDAPTKLTEQLGAMAKVQVNRARFVVPEAAARPATVAKTAEMEAAPQIAGGGLPATGPDLSALNVAIVGLNPADKNVQIPEGSRATQFSAGPKLNPDGGAGEGNKSANLTVPDLMVRGGGNDAKGAIMTLNRVAPTSAEALRGLSKYAAPSTASNPPPPGSIRVSGVPNPKFTGREIYTMAIQMPNLTSYAGSWLMWYADRGASTARNGAMSAPVPHRKVDPKYIVAAAEERIEGRVQLLCVIRNNGHVDQVELVRGIDERLDRSAMEAMEKWEFTPATRGGVAVDVDVMVEIPFRLAPRLPK